MESIWVSQVKVCMLSQKPEAGAEGDQSCHEGLVRDGGMNRTMLADNECGMKDQMMVHHKPSSQIQS